MRRRAHLLTTLLASAVAAGSLALTSTAPAAAGDSRTSWTMRSEPGDFVGSGQTWSYDEDDAIISVTGDAEAVTARVTRYDGLLWTADLAAPTGSALEVGTTYRAEYRAYREPGAAQLSVHGNGNGCDGGYGEFTIVELAVDDAGAVQRFSARFEQHCDGDEAALLGVIAWQASEPPAPLPPAPAEPVFRLRRDAALNAAVVRWTNPGADRFVTAEVRLAAGPAPATPDDGREVYSGRGEEVLVRGLEQGRDYSVSVFTTGYDGSVAGPVTRRVKGTLLRLGKRPKPGRGSWLDIRLTDLDGRGIDDAEVDLYLRRPGSDTWRRVSGWYTNARGVGHREWISSRTRHYRAVFDGAGPHLGSVSSQVRLRGEPRER